MSQPIFGSTSRFKTAVALISVVPSQALEKVISTIISRAIEDSGNAEIFSSAELEQLQSFLGVSSDELATIISGSKYVWDQACFFNLSAEKLQHQLLENHMSEENATTFAQVWHKFRVPLVEKLREHTFGTPLALADLEWRLQVSMAHDKLSKTKHVNTILDLHLADPSGAVEGENIQLEFNKEQLLELYENLEKIQAQVDKITK